MLHLRLGWYEMNLWRKCEIDAYPFNSRLSSLRNRQSVPWAMIFWGCS